MRITRLSTSLLALCLTTLIGCAASPSHRSTGEMVDDGVIGTRVKSALIANEQTKAYQINVETYEGQVQLNGFVDSPEARAAAESTARKVKGVQSVKNNLQIRAADRTAGQVIEDGVITTRVKTALIGDPRTKAYQVEVKTNAGIVELGGFVETAEARKVAEQLATAVDGVKSVRNSLQLRN